MITRYAPYLGFAALLWSGGTFAADATVTLNLVTAEGIGASVGSVRIVETRYGLVFEPKLTGLSPGLHGFHVH